jgi:hypothetical protein
MSRLWSRLRSPRGQAMSEYVVVLCALMGIVLVASSDRLPFFPILINNFQQYLDSIHMVVTLPLP